MPALNFKPEFVPAIEADEKRQTIRPKRKWPIRTGDSLYLFTGMRTRSCRRIGVATCLLERDITIKENGTILVEGQAIYRRSAERLAIADGFSGLPALLDFFERQYGLPFHGQLIEWDHVDRRLGEGS
ncbi:MAG: hypothetical protein ACX93N_16160 [Pseudohaliea sp.]